MPIAEVAGAAALIAILLSASLAVYLVCVAKRITRELRDLRAHASTAGQAVAGDLKRELGQVSADLLTAVGGSARELKDEVAEQARSHQSLHESLDAMLKSQGSELRELASSLHESTVSTLSQHESNIISALREVREEQQADAGAAAERLVAEADRGPAAGDFRREMGRMSEDLLTAVRSSSREVMDELARLSKSIELADSTLGAALQSRVSELRDQVSALHERMASRLSQHEQSVTSALQGLRDVRRVSPDAPAEVVVTKAKIGESPAATADQGAVPPAPAGAEVAVAEADAGEDLAESGALEKAIDAETRDHGGPPPVARTYNWEDLPERVRARWAPRISQLVLPPVSYYSLREDASPKELVAKAKNDPVLCAKILAVANSAVQGQVIRVTSIERAAVQLGTNLLQIIISAYHLEAIFGRYSGYSKEHFRFVQKWSCESSVFAYHIALEAGSADYAMLSTAALIARLGSLLLGMVEVGPDERYRHVPSETVRWAFEMERWKVSTPLLSERVALHWELPEPLPTLLRLQEKPMFQQLTMSPEDRNLLIVCVSSVLACAFISQGGEDLLQRLSEPQYAVLKRNTETLGLQQALGDAWASKALQREFMTVVEMTD